MNNYAVTSGDMSDALSRFASVAKTSGIDAMTALSYAVGTNEIVQSSEKTGTGLKSIITNLNGLTTSAKTGELQTNKTAKALKEIGKIDIFDKKTGQVKDMNDILGELAGKWDTYSKNEKIALGSAIAGKTQINILNSLLNNFEKVKQFQNEFKNGDMVGSAAKEKQNSPYVQKCA